MKIFLLGNSTTIQNTDEPLPEDYTTSNTTISPSASFTTLEHTERFPNITTHLPTEKSELTSNAHINSSITLTSSSSSSSANPDNYTEKPTSSVTESNFKNHTFVEKTTVRETTTFLNEASSTSLKTEESSVSTKENSTQFIFTSTPISVTTTSTTKVPLTTIQSSTTPQKTSTKILTTIPSTKQTTTSQETSIRLLTTLPTTKQTTTSQTTPVETTPKSTTTGFSNVTTFIETTTETTSLNDFGNKSITTDSKNSPLATDISKSSSFAAINSTTESTILSTTTLSSTRKTYNLRPRNRTSSTTAYTTAPVSRTTTSSPLTKSTTSTTSHSLTSWYRHPVTPFATQQTISSFVKLTSRIPRSEMTTKSRIPTKITTEIVQHTTQFPSTFTKAKKSSLPKTSDFYESKSKTTSNSNVAVVVSIVIVILVCLIAGLAYYLKRQRSKRQSKLSDDSEMKFLPDSDYMDYSDASALDRILVK